MISGQWKKTVPFALGIPVAFGFGLAYAGGLHTLAGAQGKNPPVTPSVQALDLQNSFEQVADKLRPSVVFIKSRQTVKTPVAVEGEDGASPFDFQFPGVPNGRNFRMQPRRASASGSGVIVRSDGYILTNDHVVQGADKVTVRLLDGREFVGKVKRDFKSDLALIKIEATGLAAAELADSDKVRIGQWAIAFGSPFGLNDTMTVGVVSSLHRNQAIGAGADGRYYPSLIQTDASINPGNSGGPLMDIYGRVVGINVAIESPSGGNVGIGFAIPANTAKFILEQLATNGSVTRGYLGLSPKSLSFEEKQTYGVNQGALVSSVQDETPAAKAGFQVEDVILQFNNKPVAGEAELRDAIMRTKPGTTIPVLVKRGSEEKSLNVTIGTNPEKQVAENTEPVKATAQGKLGVEVADASDEEARTEAAVKSGPKQGAIVMVVVPGGPAMDAGLRKGDLIVKMNGKKISDAEQLSKVVSGLKGGESVSLVVRRGDQTMLAQLELE